MSRERRVRKLEASSPEPAPPFIVFYRIYGIKKGTEETTRVVEYRPGPATICGLGRIHPEENETELEFKRRVYAIRAGGKLTDDMTKDELAVAYAVADQELKGCSNDD